ncbi:hypothetical protein LTR94_034585, partial [Friedmanniomyces endolithicus]
FRNRGQGAVGYGDPRQQYLVDPDHAAGAGQPRFGALHRGAFLQPGAGDGADRGDPRAGDVGRDGEDGRDLCRGAGQARGECQRCAGLHRQPRADADAERGMLCARRRGGDDRRHRCGV